MGPKSDNYCPEKGREHTDVVNREEETLSLDPLFQFICSEFLGLFTKMPPLCPSHALCPCGCSPDTSFEHQQVYLTAQRL